MKKRYWFLLIFLLLVGITYFTGPTIPKPVLTTSLPDLPDDFRELEEYVEQKERNLPVREDNQARILWATNPPTETEYSIVYLHGFAGSYRDGYPVNVNIADSLGANIFLARWAGHGLKPSASLEMFSPETAWASAKEALVIGEKIGKKVIIMSTSTGGTLAIKLAATYPESVFALINLSPNVEDDQEGAFLLNSPWGYELAKLVSFGDHMEVEHEQPIARHYWDTIYPSKALVDLQVLVDETMTAETYRNVTSPVITLFYYKNFMKEDEHVEVDDYPEVHNAFSTPPSLKKLVPLDTPGTHFIGSDIKSENTEVVEKEIIEFLRNTLKIEVRKEN